MSFSFKQDSLDLPVIDRLTVMSSLDKHFISSNQPEPTSRLLNPSPRSDLKLQLSPPVEFSIMTDAQVQRAVTVAIERVKAENPALDLETVHERSTAHRLAVQMEQLRYLERGL